MVIIKNAIENIKTNKLRVAVAMVWIVLGITSVIVVSSIGNGIEKMTEETKKNPEFRKTDITFYPNYESSISNPEFYEPFTQEDITKLSNMEGIERVTPKYGESQGGLEYTQILVENKDEFTKLIQYKYDSNLNIAYGRKFSIEDLERKTVVIDYSIAYELFNEDPESAVGQAINLNGEIFEVIGVLEEVKLDQSDKSSQYRDLETYISKNSLQDLADKGSMGSTITGLDILAQPGYDMHDVNARIQEFFEDTKDEESGSYGGTGRNEQEGNLNYLQHTINSFTSILSKVSLFIGGIGIMNIMYMSVAERKREIGIRRAIGAEPKDILVQFIIETIVITILGGLVGMLVGTFVANYASSYIGIEAIPSMESYVRAVGVSILTGAIFGAIPAIKAAKLDPIKAIQG